MKAVFKLFTIATLLIIQGCSSFNTQSESGATMSGLVIAEPLAVNYKSEIALARLTEVIQRADISDSQRAKLYYERGAVFDSVGLRALARLDFSRAIRLKPDLVEAHNFMGIHLTQLQEFIQAYDSFDSAIDLAPEHEFAYLNRGIALYYGGKPSLAIDDFKTFHKHQEADPYRILWLYLAEREVDLTNANRMLAERAKFVEENVWAKQIIQLYLGQIDYSAFLAQLTTNVRSNKALTERLCEAYFYLGKYNQFRKKDRIAANYFKLALSTNVYEFVEHRYAKLELSLMRDTIIGESPAPVN